MGAIVDEGAWTWGIQLPVQTLTRTLADPWEDEAGVDDLVTVARTADRLGAGFVGVCDHVAVPDDDYAARMTTTWYDTVATLGHLAAHTERTRLLSVVWVAAYRHPLQTAKSFGTLDHLSGGRVILGVGAGHVRGEFEALGIDFATRGRRLDEILGCVREAFDAPYVSHEGDFFSYREVGVAPRPVQPELPIWVGGMGEAAWRRVGRFGDGWIPMGNPLEQYPRALDAMREAARRAGRGEARFDVGYMPPWAYLLGDAPDDLPPAMIDGGPEPLAADIGRARAAGANVMHLKFRSRSLGEYLDQLEVFAAEVVPLVDEIGGEQGR